MCSCKHAQSAAQNAHTKKLFRAIFRKIFSFRKIHCENIHSLNVFGLSKAWWTRCCIFRSAFVQLSPILYANWSSLMYGSRLCLLNLLYTVCSNVLSIIGIALISLWKSSDSVQSSPQKKLSGGCNISINLHNNLTPQKWHYCDLPVLKIIYLWSESLVFIYKKFKLILDNVLWSILAIGVLSRILHVCWVEFYMYKEILNTCIRVNFV